MIDTIYALLLLNVAGRGSGFIIADSPHWSIDDGEAKDLSDILELVLLIAGYGVNRRKKDEQWQIIRC
jgi:hypothetical protein